MSLKRKFGDTVLEAISKKAKLESASGISYAATTCSRAGGVGADAAVDDVATTIARTVHRRLAHPSLPSTLRSRYGSLPSHAELAAGDNEKIARFKASMRNFVDPVYASQLYLKSKECEALKKDLKSAKYELDEKDNAIDEIKQESKVELEKTCKRIEETAQAELDELRRQLQQSRKEAAESCKQVEELKKKHTELDSERIRSDEEFKMLKKELGDVKAEECGLKQEIRDLKTEGGSAQDLAKTQLEAANAKTAGLKSKNSELENSKKALRREVDGVKGELDAARGEISGLEKKNRELIETSQKQLKELEGRNSELDSAKTKADDEIKSLRTEISEKNDRISALEDPVNEISENDSSEIDSSAAGDSEEEDAQEEMHGGNGSDLEARISYPDGYRAHNAEYSQSEIDATASDTNDEHTLPNIDISGSDIVLQHQSGYDVAPNGDVISSSSEEGSGDDEMEDVPALAAHSSFLDEGLDAIISEQKKKAGPTGPRHARRSQRPVPPPQSLRYHGSGGVRSNGGRSSHPRRQDRPAPADRPIAPRGPRAEMERLQGIRSSIEQPDDHYAGDRRQAALRRTESERQKRPQSHYIRR